VFARLRQLQLVLLLISIRADCERTRSRRADGQRASMGSAATQYTPGYYRSSLRRATAAAGARASPSCYSENRRRASSQDALGRWPRLASPLPLTGRVLLSGEYNVVAWPWLAAPARVWASMNARRAAGHKHDLDQQTDGLAGGRAIPRQSGILGSLPVARVRNYRCCFCDNYSKIRIESVPRFYVTYICMHGRPHIGANWVG